MAFEMKKGNAMHRNFPGAFKDVARDGETKQHPEHHLSRGDTKQKEKEIFDPNQAGINAREQKRGNSGTTIGGGHGSSAKDPEGKFLEPTRGASDRGSGSLENVNVLPEAEVHSDPPAEAENTSPGNNRREARRESRDAFKTALEAWKQGGKKGERPKRRDYK